MSAKEAVTEASEFIETLQVREVPEHPPDQPAKVEFSSGVAVKVTTAPASKVVPAGSFVSPPAPAPVGAVFKVYWVIAAGWVTVKVWSAIVMVPARGEALTLAETE